MIKRDDLKIGDTFWTIARPRTMCINHFNMSKPAHLIHLLE